MKQKENVESRMGLASLVYNLSVNFLFSGQNRFILKGFEQGRITILHLENSIRLVLSRERDSLRWIKKNQYKNDTLTK